MRRLVLILTPLVLLMAACTSTTPVPASSAADDPTTDAAPAAADENDDGDSTTVIEALTVQAEDEEEAEVQPDLDSALVESDSELGQWIAEVSTTYVSATESNDWCESAPLFEATQSILMEAWSESSPEELDAYMPLLLDELWAGSEIAPPAIDDHVTVLVQTMETLVAALRDADWIVDEVQLDEDQIDLNPAWYIWEYNADVCGIGDAGGGGWGVSTRASELDLEPTSPMDADERQRWTETLQTSGFTADEATCLTLAMERIQMPSMLGAYGVCGIPFGHMMDLLVGPQS